MLPDLLQHVAGGLDITGLPNPGVEDASILQRVLNIGLVITGALAVLTLVVAGFRFITSQGNPTEVSKARNAIVYAAAGLVVIIFAFSIVNFVIFRVT